MVPLEATSVGEAIDALLPEGEAEAEDRRSGASLLARLRRGEGGSLRRVSPATLIVRLPSGESGWAALGVAARSLSLADEDPGDPGPRILLIVRAPGSGDGEGGSLEQVARILRDPAAESRLLASASADEIRGLRRLMDAELIETLQVEHVMSPLNYRVFADTPLIEVVDLMARRGLQALPVVGEGMQVLGMVTAGEALRYALQRKARGREETGERTAATARDVMSRSVMCVSEDQELVDVAQLMINKDAGQLPVVREGEIVGILTRDAVLGALFGER